MADFKGIDAITKMFELSDIPASDDGKVFAGFEGFVVPPSYISSYNRPALSVHAQVTVTPGELFGLHASFSSIDDSGMTIHAPPHESKEKALKRLAAFREKVEEWHPFMPPRLEDWEDWAKFNGVKVQRW